MPTTAPTTAPTTVNRLVVKAFMPGTAIPAPEVLTDREVMALLRLTQIDQLHYLRRAHRIRGFRCGRRVRYALDEIMRFIKDESENDK